MEKFFYRFRSTESLLGQHQELKRQSIYFAEPKQLNDPMEGFSSVYWAGDKIAWENLFKNYVMCLEFVYGQYICGLDDKDEKYILSPDDILPQMSLDEDYNTELHKELIEDILKEFFNTDVLKLIDGILTRSTSIKRDELYFYLKSIHLYALELIRKNYKNKVFRDDQKIDIDSSLSMLRRIHEDGFFEDVERVISEQGENSAQVICSTYRNINDQMTLVTRLNDRLKLTKNKKFMIVEFTENYLNKLESICFPEWYTACFMTESHNSSVWGSYGDNHTGVCLIYKADFRMGKYYLPLKGKKNMPLESDDESHYEDMQLHPVDYDSEFESVNFFNHLGQVRFPVLSKQWHTNSKGELSSICSEMFDDIDLWRDKHWDSFIRVRTQKSIDWKYECEYRVILNNMFNNFSCIKNRTFEYSFESLHGVIFGIKTSLEDKIEIIEIINAKCQTVGRKDFRFYQAYFSESDGCVKHAYMPMLTSDH